MLKLKEVSAAYGVVPVLQGVSLEVRKGEVVAMVGANNAGKSTVLKVITGLHRATSGNITFNGTELRGLPPHKIANLGVAMVPEGRRIFSDMTLEENLLLGSHTPRARSERPSGFERVYQSFPVLKERKKQKASTLSGGEQQMLAIGRALMAKPEIILLDEPSLGLAPMLIRNVFDVLHQLKSKGLTILLVEQNLQLSLRLSERGYVLFHGRISFSGESRQLLEDKAVRKAYLGMIE
jgi:branched-chain amino acid transport system ATP-binding protein